MVHSEALAHLRTLLDHDRRGSGGQPILPIQARRLAHVRRSRARLQLVRRKQPLRDRLVRQSDRVHLRCGLRDLLGRSDGSPRHSCCGC